MATKQHNHISEQQWRDAVDAYELGTHHASQIARDLGVSASTVSREFKCRGARKGCRVAESVAELEAALDAKVRREAPLRRARDAAAMERLAAINTVIADMVKSLIAAERAGDIASVAPKVTEIGKALGVKGLR